MPCSDKVKALIKEVEYWGLAKNVVSDQYSATISALSEKISSDFPATLKVQISGVVGNFSQSQSLPSTDEVKSAAKELLVASGVDFSEVDGAKPVYDMEAIQARLASIGGSLDDHIASWDLTMPAIDKLGQNTA